MKILFLSVLALFALSLNVTLPIPLGFYDDQRLIAMVCLSALAIGLVVKTSIDLEFSSSSISVLDRCAILVLVFLIISSLLNSVQWLVALRALAYNALALVALIALIVFYQRAPDFYRRMFALTCLVTMGLYYFQFLVGYFAGITNESVITREVLIHHISNVRFLNHIQFLGTPVLIWLSLSAANPLIRRLAFIVVVIGLVIMIFCAARAAIGCLLIGLALGTLVCKLPRHILIRSVQAFVFGLVFYVIFFRVLPYMVFASEIADIKVNMTSSGRLALWLESLALIKESPLLGTGPHHYSLYSNLPSAHPHNLPLQVAVEYGFPALLFTLFLCVRFGFHVVKTCRNRKSDDFQIASVWALIAASGAALFTGVWMAPLTQLLILLLLAPVCALIIPNPNFSVQSEEAVCLSKGNRYGTNFLRVVTLVSVIFLSITTWNDVRFRMLEPSQRDQLVEKHVFNPRFWLDEYWLRQGE